MDWNVDKIFEDHGGVHDLHARLQAGYPDLTVRTVRQWQRRQNIPSIWLARIFHMNSIEVPKGWTKTVTPAPEPEMEDIF